MVQLWKYKVEGMTIRQYYEFTYIWEIQLKCNIYCNPLKYFMSIPLISVSQLDGFTHLPKETFGNVCAIGI